ncbi:sugar-binding transcriptional regulator [Acetobacterium sp.]|jgi:DNA-binding transcriptional regulator LsrR (DeoR family)|uniref:sugar-binding transcriptional regulator n=1 Tax=Acetobacterium sp. TaxID=1872094 RepID=UPI002716558B|nr:sugar-binding transcriptional regulator [Acetobacterium sp.]MDO9493344.1 sugar-binding transcriptional regulator [Acetobacterium sp.]
MKKVIDNKRLMLKVCDLFYNHDVTQQTIAKQLSISRPTVAKILEQARATQMVRIIIPDLSEDSYFEMERKLEAIYGLKEAIIVDEKKDLYAQKDEVGKAAAEYLERLVKDGKNIGVSMGTTLGHIAKYIQPKVVKNAMFIPLVGGIGQVGMELHSNYLVEELANAFKAQYILLHAPAKVSKKSIKEGLIGEAYIEKIIKLTNKLDVALVGLGVPTKNSTTMATGYYDESEMEVMRKKNVAGDICMNFFDSEGRTDQFEMNETVIGIDIKKLKSVKDSIGVTCGIEKVSAIKGAIAGQYINVLITDVACARKLIEGKDSEGKS